MTLKRTIQVSLCVILISMLNTAFAADTGTENRYVTSTHDVGVWIVDSATGEARFCFIKGDAPNYSIECINESD